MLLKGSLAFWTVVVTTAARAKANATSPSGVFDPDQYATDYETAADHLEAVHP